MYTVCSSSAVTDHIPISNRASRVWRILCWIHSLAFSKWTALGTPVWDNSIKNPRRRSALLHNWQQLGKVRLRPWFFSQRVFLLVRKQGQNRGDSSIGWVFLGPGLITLWRGRLPAERCSLQEVRMHKNITKNRLMLLLYDSKIARTTFIW